MPYSLRNRAWLLLAASITLQLVLLRSSKVVKHEHGYGHGHGHGHAHAHHLVKRGSGLEFETLDDDPSLFNFPYYQWYLDASPVGRPFIFAALVLILSFLFSFIGISASDFFCPNLATLAAVLGLSESTAGVTFLAFGNGSPDVFSTFAALNGGTFGLAVGELLGAATFIVSVIVGSIALIEPFHVPRYAFLRDTVFFTLAVLLLIYVLHDGHLSIYESGGMVLLYLAYVATVVGGSWYQPKVAIAITTPTDSPRLPSPTMTPLPSPHHAGIPRRIPNNEEEYTTQRANFSLLGAIEFRDVVNSLRKDQSRSPSPQRSPTQAEGPDYFGAWHRRSSSAHDWTQYNMASALEANVTVASAASPVSPSVGVGKRRRAQSLTPRSTSIGGARMARQLGLTALDEPRDPDHLQLSDNNLLVPDHSQPPHHSHASDHLQVPNQLPERPGPGSLRLQIPPVIHITDPCGHDQAPPPSPPLPPPNRLHTVLRTLFPSLQGFGQKSWVGRFIGIVSVPAVILLTLTLPVVDSPDEGHIHLHTVPDEPLNEVSPAVGEELHHLVETGFSALHSPMSRLKEHNRLRRASQPEAEPMEEVEEEDGEVGRFRVELTAAQCVFGPVFCVAYTFGDLEILPYIVLATTLVGLTGAVAVLIVAVDGSQPTWRMVRCICGFICSMVWIAAIANEVVSVLIAIGEILGLSEAIIGLTIFAIGNSLADLVANVTVAQFAPTMAYAACFGGPMLNLLLGIGGSGTYGILVARKAVTIHFSPTLWVSAAGLVLMLLATAIVVPLNGYLIDRRWATCLIIGYGVLMAANIAVELKMGKS